MVNVEIQVTPFALNGGIYTVISVDECNEWLSGRSSKFNSYVIQKPISKWMCPYRERVFAWHGFLPSFVNEIYDDKYSFWFSGTMTDYFFFEREIYYQAKHMISQPIQVDVNLKNCLDMCRISKELETILKELYYNSTISKMQKHQIRYLRRWLNSVNAEITKLDALSTLSYSVIKAQPEGVDVSDADLRPIIPEAYVFLASDKDEYKHEWIFDAISCLKKFKPGQLDHTHIFAWTILDSQENNVFEKLIDECRKNNISIKDIKVFASESQIKKYMNKEMGQYVFQEQNVNNAVNIIEDSIIHDNASEEVICGYRKFQNMIFCR